MEIATLNDLWDKILGIFPSKTLVITALSYKQDIIDSSHKLSADLISDGSTNKVINVKPNWNASTGDAAEILNKPTIPTVPTNVSAFTNDAGYVTVNNYGTVYIETAAGSNKTATVPMTYSLKTGNIFILYLKTTNTRANATLSINNTTAKSVRIDGVATTSSNWTQGTYLCYYDGSYYLIRSNWNPFGSSISGNTITIDGNSITVLTSHQDISGKEDKAAISTKSSNFTATVGNYYNVTIGASTSRTITLTTPSDSTKISSCIFHVTTSTSPSLTLSSSNTIKYSDNYVIEADCEYEINALWDGTKWYVTLILFT